MLNSRGLSSSLTLRTAGLILVLTLMMAWCGVSGVSAQDMELRPLREFEEAAREGNRDATRYVVRRCAALYLIVAELLSSGRATNSVDRYAETAELFLTAAIEAEMALGSDLAQYQQAVHMAVGDIGTLIIERMRRNMALSGSYLSSDPLLTDDTTWCSQLLAALGE